MVKKWRFVQVKYTKRAIYIYREIYIIMPKDRLTEWLVKLLNNLKLCLKYKMNRPESDELKSFNF